MIEPIAIGIVGCGAITRQLHLPAVLLSDRFRLAGIVDRNVEAARFLAKLFDIQVPIYESTESAKCWDAAIVAVPPHLHAEISCSLLEQGIHVLCEKPLATRLAEAEHMLRAAHINDVHLAVVMQKFFQPNTALFKDLLNSGCLGAIVGIELECVQRSEWNAGNPERYDPNFVPGGVTFENGIHWLYRVDYWFGSGQVRRYADDRFEGVEANAEIDCGFDIDGRLVGCHMVFSADRRGNNRLVVKGTEAEAIIEDGKTSSVLVRRELNSHPSISELRRPGRNDNVDYGLYQLDYFGRLICGETRMTNPIQHSVAALRLLAECYRNRELLPQPWV